MEKILPWLHSFLKPALYLNTAENREWLWLATFHKWVDYLDFVWDSAWFHLLKFFIGSQSDFAETWWIRRTKIFQHSNIPADTFYWSHKYFEVLFLFPWMSMKFFWIVFGKVSCSSIRNSDKNSCIDLELFLNISRAIWFLRKHILSIAPFLRKIREIRWLQIFSGIVQRNSFGSRFWLENSWLWLLSTELFCMKRHVNPLSILKGLSHIGLQKKGKKCWQVIFSQIPQKYIVYFLWLQ